MATFVVRPAYLLRGIRRATEDDIPRILEIARACYPVREVDKVLPWLKWILNHEDRLSLIGAHSIGAASITAHYGFEQRARLDVLASLKPCSLEAFRMLRIMVQWAQQRGIEGSFRLDADTGVVFEPFARRLGGKAVTTTHYAIPLGVKP